MGDKMTNIYDIMAWAYRKLCPFDFNKVCGYKPENGKEIFDLFDICYEKEKNFSREAVNKIYGKLSIMENEITDSDAKSEFYYLIIMAVDTYEYRYASISTTLRQIKSMTGLNEDNADVLIYPKMQRTVIHEISDNLENYEKKQMNKRRGGLRKRKDIDTNGINKRLNNYIIIERCDMKEYDINLHILQDGGVFSKQVLDKQCLDILIFPFDDNNIENVMNIEMGERFFDLKGYKKEDEFCDRYIELITYAMQYEADIVIFPEMYLSMNIVDKVSEKIKSMKIRKNMIIVIGTLWENKTNICFICNHRGKIIIRQHKQSPFLYKGKDENLANKEKILHFLDIDAIGRLAFGVCKDIDNERILQKMKALMCDVYIFPAFSPSLNIIRTAEELAKSYNGITVFANACAAMCNEKKDRIDVSKEKKVGFVTIPCKYEDKSGVKSYYYCYNNDCNSCNCCKGKKIKILLNQIVEENGSIVCNML